MRKERISWIDIARGIGIILVVYGHALSSDSFRYVIYAFHMPLFFFLSGMVFKYKPEEQLIDFIKKNARSILLPYFLFAIISYLLWWLTKHVSTDTLITQFLSIFYGNGNGGLLAFNNILWFLPCLFITRCGFYVLTRFTIKTNVILSLLFIISLVGYVYSLFFSAWKLFFGIETALTAIVFFGLGYCWNIISEKTFSRMKQFSWLLIIVCAGLCIAFAVLNYSAYGLQIDLRQDRLNNYFYFYLSAISGIIATVFLSIAINKQVVVEYMGRKTLILFAWHLIAFSYISKILSLTHLQVYLKMVPTFFSPIIYSILAILFLLTIDFLLSLLRKYTKTFF